MLNHLTGFASDADLCLDHGGLESCPFPVRSFAEDIRLLLSFVANLVNLDPGQLFLKRFGQLVELLLVLGRDRVIISPEGFVIEYLFGSESWLWEDIVGRFVVIKIGLRKAVAYNVTAEYMSRTGKKTSSLFPGYNAAIIEQLFPAGELAELLNEHKQRYRDSDEPATPEGIAAEIGGTAAEGSAAEIGSVAPKAEDNESVTLRVAAAVLAPLFAAIPFLDMSGKLDLKMAVVIGAVAILFGWYAVFENRGIPRWMK